MALHNREALQKLNGTEVHFEAQHQQVTRGMNWPGSNVLHLKPGCRVMLVWNINDRLRNGSQGVFLECVGEKLKVLFPEVGDALIERQTWFKRDKHGIISGSICQYPIVLAYAVTCHKSEGLTLPSAIVHCSPEFVPGLIYIAISRVRVPDHLQLLGFKAEFLLPPHPRVLRENSAGLGDLKEDLSCCCNNLIPFDKDHLFEVRGRFSEEEKHSDDNFTYPIELFEGPAASHFQNDDGVVIDIIELYDELSKPESNLSRPPPSLDVRQLLRAKQIEKPQDEFAQEKNDCLQKLVASHETYEQTNAFVKILWFHLYCIFKDHVIENPEDVIVNIAREGFTSATAMLHEFLNSDMFGVYQKALYQSADVTFPEMAVACELVLELYGKFLGQLADAVTKIQSNDQDPPMNLRVEEMSEPGKGKIRHVGGWAIRRVLENSRSYIRHNIDTKFDKTLLKAKESLENCKLIEKYLLIPYARLEAITSYPETLEVTDTA